MSSSDKLRKLISLSEGEVELGDLLKAMETAVGGVQAVEALMASGPDYRDFDGSQEVIELLDDALQKLNEAKTNVSAMIGAELPAEPEEEVDDGQLDTE